MLGRHAYPGNVRELENIIERAFVLCGDGPIDLVHLPEELGAQPIVAAPGSALDRAEALALAEALRRHGGDRGRVAAELGMHRTTLYRKMRQHGLISARADPFKEG